MVRSPLAALLALAFLLSAQPAAQKSAPGSPPLKSPVPLAHFGAHPPRGEAPLTVRFEDRSFGDLTAWRWDFGDGTSSTQRNPTHVYTEGGVYEVRLTVSGPDGSATVVKPRGVTVTTCTPGNARVNRPSPLERGEDFVPVTGDDALGFWCVYSGKAVSQSNPGLANNVGMFVFPLANGEVLLFGSGYGDENSMVTPTESAAHDVRRIDGILRFCLGLAPELTTVRFVAPHGHIDHINSDCIHELKKRGYRIGEIVFHTLDGTESRNLPGWTAQDQALFRTIRNSTTSCQEDLLSYASPLGRIWFHVRAGHTNGSIDLVLDTLGDANNRFLVLGSGSSFGDCPIPGVRESIEPHGNVQLGAPEPVLTALAPDHLSALGGTEVVLTGQHFAATRAGLPLVLFDGVPASAVVIQDDDTLTCIAPPGIPGERGAVELVNRNGSASLADAFRYRAWPTLASVSPTHGVESGGTRITLRGSGFLDDAAGPNAITIDGVAATGLASVTDTSLTCVVPAGAPGLATIRLTNSNGAAELADAFRYDPKIDVTGVAPATGTSRGGVRVEITGSAFAVGAELPAVFFGGAPASDVVRLGDTRLQCTTPPGTPGTQVDLRVSAENGSDTLPAAYRYFSAPSIASAAPSSGSALGGLEVTLSGSSFQRNGAGPNTVLFGTVPALSITPVSDTALRCVAPPGVAGTSVDLVVSNANGSGRLANGFRYHRAPLVTALEPASGPRAGGVSVTLQGSGFAETASGLPGVFFGSVAALDVLVLDDTRLTCRAPAQTSDGQVDVRVSTANGASTLPAAFRYVSRPTLSAISPTDGSARGGTRVTLSGSAFAASGAGTTEVRFGGRPAREVRVLDDSTLTAVTPLGTPDTRVAVLVVNANGSAQLPQAFRYRALPTLVGVAPTQGPPAGGTLVTLRGSGFAMAGLVVEFGGQRASELQIVSDEVLTCRTPAGVRGASTVLVRGEDGVAVLDDGFVYGTTKPEVLALEPDHGSALAPTLVRLRGSGFLAAEAGSNRITFGGVAATRVAALNDETIECLAPAGTPGARVDVRVVNTNGSDTLAAGYRYHLQPALTSLEPAVASPVGGATLTLHGSGFLVDQAGPPAVFVGTQPATEVVVLDDASVTCRVPPGTPGALVDVRLENANGHALAAGAFLYRGAPELSALNPTGVSPLGGATLTLSGVGFLSAGAPSVRIGALAATAVVVLDDTQVTCTVPPLAPGSLFDVELTNENGSARLAAALRAFAAPNLVARSPASGTPLGGTTVTLTGSGFLSDVLGPNSVTFGGVPARSVTTVDDTRVRAVTPGGTPGSVVDVELHNSNGQDTLPAAFRYHLEPTLASLTPPSAAAPGGIPVTLSGSGFQRDSAGVATVLFGSVPAASVSVLDDQTITCLAPAGVAGTSVVVQVSNRNGTTHEPVPFAFHAAPTLAGLSPSSGVAAGGTEVELSGSGFLAQAAGTNQVHFGGTPASQVVVLDDATLTCVAPAGTRGATVDVGLVNANGAALLAGAFLYRSAPELLQVTPTSVSPLGGATLTLDGLNFSAAAPPTVRIGGTLATSVVTLSDTQLTCVVPAGSAGSLVDVELTTEDGSALLASALRYFAAPDLVARSPASGTSLGGTTVVLTGSGFLTDVLGPNAVTFGGVPARSVTTVDDTRVRAVSPTHTPGAVVDLRLTNSNGEDTLVGAYRFHLEPTLASLAPPSVPPAGGVLLTLSGSGFQRDAAGAPTVLFGPTAVTAVTVVDDQTLTCLAPAGAAGSTISVQVTNKNGATRESVQLRYRAAPTLTSVTPAFGFSGGGTHVELTGSGFLDEAPGPNQVLFGTQPASEVVVLTDASLQCRVPAGAPGAVSVQLGNANGTAVLPGAFEYDWTPTVTAFTPASGTALGGTLVEISGGGFASPGGGALSVRFGGVLASEVSVLDGFRLSARTPAGVPASTVDVSVTNSRGSGSLAGFQYHPLPTLSTLSPVEGPPQGGTTVTLTGSGFLGSGAGLPSVRFGTSLASSVTVLSDTSLTCVAPSGNGLASVTLTNENGSAARADAWRWLLRHPGDLDGDGRGDLVLAASDGVYVFFTQPFGPDDESTAAPDLVLRASATGTELGSQLALGDLDGDGQADLVLGARLDDTAGIDAGSVYVFRGPLAPSVNALFTSGADHAFHGASPGDRFGSALAVRDVTGDGRADLIVGAPFDDQSAADAGAAFVYRGGPAFTSQSTAQAGARLLGGGSQHLFGSALATGDVNGDGQGDVLVGAPQNNASGGNSGAVHVFLGGAGLTHASANQAQVTIAGASSNDKLGTTLAAGDLTGDGIDELVLGAPDAKIAGSQSGSVFVLRGSTTLASGSAASAMATYNGEAAGDRLAHALALGDADGDGKLDLLLGAPLHDVPATSAGRAYLVLGAANLVGGSIGARATMIVMGENSSGDQLGVALALNDLDGDGKAELLVGSPFSNASALDVGRVHVFLGSALQATRFASADDATVLGHLLGQTLGRRLVGPR